MNTKYNGPEEWQKIKTMEWVKKIKETLLLNTHVIFDGQTRPSFIQHACNENGIVDYEVILFDCSDEERSKRLVSRGHTELVNEQMMNWAKYLRKECQKENYYIIGNSLLTHEETPGVFN